MDKKRKKTKLDLALNVLIPLFIILATLAISKRMHTGTVQVLSDSMYPTIVSSESYDFKVTNVVDRFDIVLFRHKETELSTGVSLVIKRVIGIPGDTIDISGSEIYINGELTKEDYVVNKDNSYNGTFKVPVGHYFVMGDNRLESYDSRFWDNPFISKDVIEGKVVLD